MNPYKYFSFADRIDIGLYAYGLMPADELGKYLSIPPEVINEISSEIDLKNRILKGGAEIDEALKDFAIKIEQYRKQNMPAVE